MGYLRLAWVKRSFKDRYPCKRTRKGIDLMAPSIVWFMPNAGSVLVTQPHLTAGLRAAAACFDTLLHHLIIAHLEAVSNCLCTNLIKG